jgi:protein phosphatase
LLQEQHLGAPVQCKKCARTFLVQIGAVAQAPPAPAQPAMCRLDIACATSTGRVRKRNEDSFLVQYFTWFNLDQRHELALVVVADGMGGHEAGDQASGIAIRAAGSAVAPLLSGALSGQFKDSRDPMIAESMAYALQEANRAVFRKAQANPAFKGMAATADIVLIWDNRVMIAHVGDTRVYHQRAHQLKQVTKDQTLVARMIELGQLTPEEAVTNPARNEVLQGVGKRFDIEPASYELMLQVGDWLLVACDGLHAHLDARVLQDTISQASASAPLLANRLVELADQNGGSDNCTVAVVRCY